MRLHNIIGIIIYALHTHAHTHKPVAFISHLKPFVCLSVRLALSVNLWSNSEIRASGSMCDFYFNVKSWPKREISSTDRKQKHWTAQKIWTQSHLVCQIFIERNRVWNLFVYPTKSIYKVVFTSCTLHIPLIVLAIHEISTWMNRCLITLFTWTNCDWNGCGITKYFQTGKNQPERTEIFSLSNIQN